ncbi:MAG: M23 family metallopeptidase [Candidatus Magasanikbacteria bacterium]|nr:M23 family metallopeptidase [Candidatus Magasanikbacteria bacterium]
MRRILYTTLAKLVRGLAALGRAMKPLFLALFHAIGRILHVIAQKLVFVFLKFGRFLRRYWQGYSAPLKDKIWFIITSPWTLRLVILVGISILLVPQTHLRARDTGPNFDSLLYQLVGPGDEYFVEEGIEGPLSVGVESWSTGSVRQEVLEPGGGIEEPEPTDLSGLALGGTAVTKPTIIPGAQVGRERKEVIEYVVRAGDTVGGIAEAFGLNITTILWENALSFRSYIRPGDTIRILPVDGIRYEVKRGDTLAKIAKLYTADPARIVEFNKLADATDITIGQRLILPGGAKPVPVYIAPPASSRRLADIAAPLPSIFVPAGQLYVWPTTVRRITQYFGWRHTGVDVAGPIGTPLIASRAGRVVSAKCGWNGGYGCHVILDHGDGVRTMYAHASRVYVDVGETVEQGQAIAGMGSTGRSTGSHIHFEVRVNGVRANPLKFVR